MATRNRVSKLAREMVKNMKKLNFFEASYWGYYYNLTSDEFESLLLSNNIDLELTSFRKKR